MKIIYWLITSILLFNKAGSDKKKLQKSFAEIFGEGWEEKEQKAVENLENSLIRDRKDGIGQCQTKILQKDKNNNYSEQTNEKPTDQYDQGHENGDQSGNNQQKIEIIRKFRAIKEKIKHKGIKFIAKEWHKIEKTIAKKFGSNRTEIYRMIRKFGMRKHQYNLNAYSDQQKREIIRKFRAIKEKIKQKGINFSRKEKGKIEKTIAKELGTSRTKIYSWIKEFCMGIKKKSNEIYSEKQKFGKVQQFLAMCNEYKQNGKHSTKEWNQKYAEISKKIGVCYRTIQNWKKEFGMSREQKSYTNEEKLEIMRQYWEMKRNMPKISGAKIAKILQIDVTNISKWKSKFREENI